MIPESKLNIFKQIYLLYLQSRMEKAIIKGDAELYFKFLAKHFEFYFEIDMYFMAFGAPESEEINYLYAFHSHVIDYMGCFCFCGELSACSKREFLSILKYEFHRES